jgi:hypothetical protein
MAWNVTDYPQPREIELEDDRYECEGFHCTNLIEEGEEATCNHADCHRTYLCAGCTFECADCGLTFCREHILAHEHANRMATYRCEACDLKREQEAA